MKKIVTLLTAIVLLTLPTVAQDNKRPRFNLEEFKTKMETYITQKAGLSQKEAEKAFPIFHEMKSKQFELMRKAQKIKSKRNNKLESEADFQNALTTLGEISVETAKIEMEYYKKMSKSISAQKAYRIKMADDAFHREILQHFEAQHKKERTNKP